MSSSNAKEVALKSLEQIASLNLEGWLAVADENILMRFPFAPEGFPKACEGRDQCAAIMGGIFAGTKSFEWIDLEAFATEDPELVFATARSKAEMVDGKTYANQYCFKIRVRNGRVIESNEFFNPLIVMATFG